MANCKTWVAIWVAFLVAAALGVAPALAQEKKQLLPGNFSTNFGLYSDYTFRGISQTGNDPAVQGSRSPDAISNCARTRSAPVTASVTGCSTWRRVFISRK